MRGMTLARRRCARCERTVGYALWRWSGRLFVTTHTLCRGCLRERQPAFARRSAAVVLSSRYLC